MKSYILFLLIIFQWSFAQHDAIYAIGEKLINENKLDEAKIYFENNLKKATNNELKIKLFVGLAETYKLQLDYNASNKYYTEAYKIIKKTNNIQLEFLYHVKMAEFYRKRALHIESVAQLEKATVILKKNKIKDLYLAKYYNRKAALFTEYFHIKDSTLLYAKKSLKLAKKLNDKDNIFYSLLEIAGVYEREKDYETSIKYLEEIIQFAKSNNLLQQEADAYISYIMALARSNQLEKALNVALYAANFSKKHKFYYNEIIFNENIQNLYFRLNNTEKAYEYLKYRSELTTKYNELKKEELVLNLETKYKSKEKDNILKINALKIINKDKELKSNKAKILIISGLFVITILITFLIAYFLRKSKKANQKLQFLSDQNEFLLSEANHRINNNLQLIIILINNQLEKSDNSENIEIKKILNKISSIATLHRHLYKSKDKKKIDIKNYLHDIYSNFSDLFKQNNIISNFEVASFKLKIDDAMYIGLIVTELYINSIKHAFHNQEHKQIDFNFKLENKQIIFNYQDNGELITNKPIPKPTLIHQLCRQLEVDCSISTTKGFQFTFTKSL